MAKKVKKAAKRVFKRRAQKDGVTPSLERQHWVEHAVEALRAKFATAGYAIPEKIRVSIGWPNNHVPTIFTR